MVSLGLARMMPSNSPAPCTPCAGLTVARRVQSGLPPSMPLGSATRVGRSVGYTFLAARLPITACRISRLLPRQARVGPDDADLATLTCSVCVMLKTAPKQRVACPLLINYTSIGYNELGYGSLWQEVLCMQVLSSSLTHPHSAVLFAPSSFRLLSLVQPLTPRFLSSGLGSGLCLLLMVLVR